MSGAHALLRHAAPAAIAPGTVEPTRDAAPWEPRIGLALGGGAARGWAHIGVIRALDEAGIHPAVVAGCSIGAVVGGCFAAGKLDALAEFALSLTRRRVLGLLDPRLSGSGLIGGDRLRRRLVRDLGDRLVDDLPVGFASVATELGTGHEVWLTRGSLIEALRASYALPGLFAPVERDGRLLMDGTLVNPVPVTLARAMGADLVIGVSLACDPRLRGGVIEPEAVDPVEQVVTAVGARRWNLLAGLRNRRVAPSGPGIGRVMFDAFNITQDRISRARLERDPPDCAIGPDLAAMGQFEFHRAAEGIAAGHAATRAALPRIRAMVQAAAARA
ncbi:patatin-like phospholipase family protein [Methylobacterium sp. J-092]|uniref:patatin-like phospholipase family protein n=1 Tax=Methylobacterium sp. J-092 TaxID=2836667 RepID=UPI001FB9E5E3|nr:patatin-like phospholipase family protein [Methylobacterium sp. J-092]MCJ2009997.1 patatin-like phospholipase family protein [Methylobacterium sp. J-092]